MSRKFFVAIICAFCGMSLFGGMTADAGVLKTSMTVSLSDVSGDRSWGLMAATPYQHEGVEGNATATLQNSGNIYRGKYHAEIGFDVGDLKMVFSNDGNVRGYEIDSLGRQSDLTAELRAREFEVGDFVFEFGLEVFGRNAGKWGDQNAFQFLENGGFNVGELEEIEGLNEIVISDSNFSFKSGNSFHTLGKLTAQHESGVSGVLKLMPEVIKEMGSPSLHQAMLSLTSKVKIKGNVNLQATIDVIAQLYDGNVQTDVATVLGLNIEL